MKSWSRTECAFILVPLMKASCVRRGCPSHRRLPTADPYGDRETCPLVGRAAATPRVPGDRRRTLGLFWRCSTAYADDLDGSGDTVFADSNEASHPLDRELWLYDRPW
jgi:hypothetical protein